jgi:hypothetical protein
VLFFQPRIDRVDVFNEDVAVGFGIDVVLLAI